MSSTTSITTIEKLRSLFAQFGLPHIIVTDNGTNFTSAEFQEFCHSNAIKHITSAPFHPSSNGLAERAVQTVKQGLVKMTKGSITDQLSRFLFSYRNTPLQLTGSSPSELLLGRRARSLLDQLKPNLLSKVEHSQFTSKQTHDSVLGRENFQVGDTVYARNYSSKDKWVSAIVERITGPVSMVVRCEDTNLQWRRHLDQVRPRIVRCLPDNTDYWHPTSEGNSQQDSREILPKRVSRPPDRLSYQNLGGRNM